MTRAATPLVRKTAARLHVDLDAIAATGVGGRVTIDDVYRASRQQATAHAKPLARAHNRPSLIRSTDSMWTPHVTLDMDVFALNPLIDDLRQADPKAYAYGERRGPAPEMFTAGPVPVFTAAGFDPEQLLQLPWIVRHAAAEADQALAAKIFDKCGGGDLGAFLAAGPLGLSSPGLGDYKNRIRAWARP